MEATCVEALVWRPFVWRPSHYTLNLANRQWVVVLSVVVSLFLGVGCIALFESGGGLGAGGCGLWAVGCGLRAVASRGALAAQRCSECPPPQCVFVCGVGGAKVCPSIGVARRRVQALRVSKAVSSPPASRGALAAQRCSERPPPRPGSQGLSLVCPGSPPRPGSQSLHEESSLTGSGW